MIEHFIPLKLTHDQLQKMRDMHSRLIDLQTQGIKIGTPEDRELWELEDSFGDFVWLVEMIVNATEA